MSTSERLFFAADICYAAAAVCLVPAFFLLACFGQARRQLVAALRPKWEQRQYKVLFLFMAFMLLMTGLRGCISFARLVG